MNPVSTIAIFDIGRTNKKFFLINEDYKIVWERSAQLEEIKDEDGDACEDVSLLTAWVHETIKVALHLEKFAIKAINFSAYGASLVYLDEKGNVMAPLYNYLKPFSPELKKTFYTKYGGEEKVSLETASPVLGNLNSAMQLYRLKYEQGGVFDKIKYALHLPQYISYILTKKPLTDITSIGCHTLLWNFQTNTYHRWTKEEGIDKKMPPLFSSDDVMEAGVEGYSIKSGIGLHDSSAALIPYLANFTEPFILISTGTWCISFNPFKHEPLTSYQLENDCLCYLQYNGKPVQASRLFAGAEHEEQTKRLAVHFNKKENYYTQVAFNSLLPDQKFKASATATSLHKSGFQDRDLHEFSSYEQAYHCFMQYIVAQQYAATTLVMSHDVTRIFVDGGFGKNSVYMNLLSAIFPDKEVFAASVSQATAIGAALAIHEHWNTKPVTSDMIRLKLYAAAHKTIVE
ncbi:MAG: FGGY family carbohydrate kinase [Ginsengibacter sp.]